MTNAFYYNDEAEASKQGTAYFLLPEGHSCGEAFLAALDKAGYPFQVEAIPLLEDNGVSTSRLDKGLCIAPYFLTGYNDKPVKLTITDKQSVYPATVERMSQREYNKRIRELVKGYCPGCIRYGKVTAMDSSLNGHFEEISLDGTCLVRCETPDGIGMVLFQTLAASVDLWNDVIRLDREPNSETFKEFFLEVLGIQTQTLSALVSNNTLMLYLYCGDDFFNNLAAVIAAKYLETYSLDRYSISLGSKLVYSEDYITELTKDENKAELIKQCKAHGIAFALLQYDGEGEEQIAKALAGLAQSVLIYPLSAKEGERRFVLSDTDMVLQKLRYHAPVLEAYNSKLTVYEGKEKNKRYSIDYKMQCESIE